jgi:hypothetical protein
LSFLLTITWQFAQFVLLLETIMLFGLALVGILDRDKASSYLVFRVFFAMGNTLTKKSFPGLQSDVLHIHEYSDRVVHTVLPADGSQLACLQPDPNLRGHPAGHVREEDTRRRE